MPLTMTAPGVRAMPSNVIRITRLSSRAVRGWSAGALRPLGTSRGLPHRRSPWRRSRPRSAPSTRPVSSCDILTRYRPDMPVISLPNHEWIDHVGPMGGVEVVPWDLSGEPPRPDELSFVVAPHLGSPAWQQLGQLPGLRVVQLLS